MSVCFGALLPSAGEWASHLMWATHTDLWGIRVWRRVLQGRTCSWKVGRGVSLGGGTNWGTLIGWAVVVVVACTWDKTTSDCGSVLLLDWHVSYYLTDMSPVVWLSCVSTVVSSHFQYLQNFHGSGFNSYISQKWHMNKCLCTTTDTFNSMAVKWKPCTSYCNNCIFRNAIFDSYLIFFYYFIGIDNYRWKQTVNTKIPLRVSIN